MEESWLLELADSLLPEDLTDEALTLAGQYRFDPLGYIVEKLGWDPWEGEADQPGQLQVIDAYTLAIRQQLERRDFEAGERSEDQLRHWQPGQTIQNWLRIEAGFTVGKTKLASGLLNHFFDCYLPSIIYTFAPSWEQIHDLLWKEIKADRAGKGLPGRILDLALDRGANHFAKGRATDNTHGTGAERVQGQHGEYLMFVLDEAEGIPDFVWDAVEAMTSGGICIVLILANPRTRISRFHKVASEPQVRNFRISSLWHPNVLAGREVVPGAVQRHYVDGMIDKHCEIVERPDPDTHTFDVPWRPGLIFKPDAEFLFSVLGMAPAHQVDNTLISTGRYQAAKDRERQSQTPLAARMGVDVARWGKDLGTLYVRHDGVLWREAQFAQQDTFAYAQAIKNTSLRLKEQGVVSIHVRVDGGGGFGGGVIDSLSHDLELARALGGIDFRLIEVHFNGVPYDQLAYADLATEMYADLAEALQLVRLDNPPDELERDLTERTYRWWNWRGYAVKRLEPKDQFKKRVGRSPDDGDGAALAAAADHVFESHDRRAVHEERVSIGPRV